MNFDLSNDYLSVGDVDSVVSNVPSAPTRVVEQPQLKYNIQIVNQPPSAFTYKRNVKTDGTKDYPEFRVECPSQNPKHQRYNPNIVAINYEKLIDPEFKKKYPEMTPEALSELTVTNALKLKKSAIVKEIDGTTKVFRYTGLQITKTSKQLGEIFEIDSVKLALYFWISDIKSDGKNAHKTLAHTISYPFTVYSHTTQVPKKVQRVASEHSENILNYVQQLVPRSIEHPIDEEQMHEHTIVILSKPEHSFTSFRNVPKIRVAGQIAPSARIHGPKTITFKVYSSPMKRRLSQNNNNDETENGSMTLQKKRKNDFSFLDNIPDVEEPSQKKRKESDKQEISALLGLDFDSQNVEKERVYFDLPVEISTDGGLSFQNLTTIRSCTWMSE